MKTQPNGVIYHPHPLNKNVETIDSSRYQRGSRKNLAPIAQQLNSSRERNVPGPNFNTTSNQNITMANKNIQFKFKKNS